ncbi:MAG: efflux RND transporter permease subunit [Lentimicrobium sp.]|nr:efflux RND transporter permease subunit [Lentimicrobium sp.]MDD2527039.1 efflux RND transporter permease subunit [Lentimicrobiaceae bacterium]MDD4597642.1 efflux RND transporter permease subunit [Lentimicrobiaceae bacterium]HAH56587.1 acriflavin resistance protein [Bacteroidales bacterium]
MSLSSLSINRPVLATVMSIVIVLFGIIGLVSIGIREYPSVDPPIVSISTSYVGASADVIESQITEPLEESVNGIAGIRTLTSTSRDGRSYIRVEFDLGVDLETAANDVRDKVSVAIRQLPPDVDPPVVTKADADASPIIFVNIRSEQRTLLEINEIAERVFKERLQTIPGVSQIQIWGARRYSMRLWMDPAKLSAFGITPVDIRTALQRENVELPSGRIEGSTVELTVRTMGRLVTPEDFNSLILRQEGDEIVRFRDVGYAELGTENDRSILRRDGVPMVGDVIIPQPGSNHIEIADEFYRRLEQIKKDLPKDVTVGIGFDTTEFIRDSIKEVEQSIYLAFFLVVLIIFMFLRDWRTTIIPVIVIPISLIGAFFIMYIAGFSINVLTLLGIVLAIGLVVDDAIVVLENIYTKIERGMPPLEAGIQGSSEIFFAIIATTIALATVFLPVIFLEGITGRLFREFGIVLAGSVIISSFVALTLTPMLSTKILKRRDKHNWIYNVTEPFFVRLNTAYANSLRWFLGHRWLALVISLIALLMIYGLGSMLQTELAPLEDRSGLRVVASAPEGATFDYMDKYMTEVTQMIQEKVPESQALITITSPGWSGGTNSGFIRIKLVNPDKRERSQQELAGVISREVKKFSSARAYVAQDQSIGGGGGGLPVQYVIQAPNLEKLKKILPDFMAEVQKSDKFQYADLNLRFNKPEVKVNIDREKARNLGVSVIDIAQTLQLGLSGQRFGYFIMDGKQYQVIGQMEKAYRSSPLDLRSLTVRNNRGEMLQLDNFVTLKEDVNPPQLFRYNRFVSATVSANPAEGLTIGDGINEMDRIANKVLDDSYSTSLTGASKDFAESSSSLVFAFVLALVLIYLVLSAQFESFRDPFIIMFTVPLALAGAVLTLWYFNKTLNIFSEIGAIMLIGLVTKNGILIVEFANQRKAAGLSRLKAISEASVSRFRPILMTSLSTILGATPIALALGAGSESRVSMGTAIIGGLAFSTILTLYVVPAMYVYISAKTRSVSNVDELQQKEDTE